MTFSDNKDRAAADGYLEPREYVAANLRDALSLVPDTGDWHGQLRHWCDAQGGKAEPNRCADQLGYYQMRDKLAAADAEIARLRAALAPYVAGVDYQRRYVDEVDARKVAEARVAKLEAALRKIVASDCLWPVNGRETVGDIARAALEAK